MAQPLLSTIPIHFALSANHSVSYNLELPIAKLNKLQTNTSGCSSGFIVSSEK
jgi:hypothetical protein